MIDGSLDKGTIYVLDDDHGFRSSMQALADSIDLAFHAAGTVRELLTMGPARRPACLVIDHRLEEGSIGREAIELLQRDGWRIPIIVCSAYVSVPLAVEYMRCGADTVLEKPLQGQQIADRIEEAIRLDLTACRIEQHYSEMRFSFDELTSRQKVLIGYLCQGLVCKKIADALDVSRRTIDIEKATVFRTLNISSPMELGLWLSNFLALHCYLGYDPATLDLPPIQVEMNRLIACFQTSTNQRAEQRPGVGAGVE